MKKSLSRILSLALVLAMLISVVPFALAAGVTLTADKTELLPGESANLSVSPYSPAEGETDVQYQWSGNVTVSGTSAVYTAPATVEEQQTVTVSVTVTALKTVDGTESRVEVASDSITITVKPPVVPAESVSVVPVSAELKAGETIPLSATVTPENTTDTVVWTSSNNAVATVSDSGVVTAVSKGTALITATAGSFSASCAVTVTSDYSVTATAAKTTLIVGETTDLQVTAKHGDTPLPEYTAKVKSGEDKISLTGTKIKALKAGSAVIEVTVGSGTDLVHEEVAITVVDGGIICPNVSKVSSYNNTVTLEPKYGVNGVYDDNVTFTFEKAGNTGSVGTTTGIVTCTGSGLVAVKITAYRGTEKLDDTTTVYVSFYESADIDVTMKSTFKSFAFGDATALTGGKALSSLITGPLVGKGDKYNGEDIQFSYSDTTGKVAVLELPQGSVVSQDKTALVNLDKVVFKLTGGTGKDWKFGYTVKRDDIILGVGSVTISFTGSAGDIVYATDYKTDVTFDEYDFQKFWTADKTTTGTLQYVEFAVGTSVPNRGRLYTTMGKTKQVTSSMVFKPDFTSSATYYDLDTVTYEPSSLYTTYYTVEIPFTAYGSNNQTLNGTVVIEINGSSSSITSRGVRFGNTSIVADMAEEYYGKTGKELSYATFYLPDVEDGRLFYNYSGILESTKVTAKDKFYYYASNVKTRPNADLDKITFVPAAGTIGKITLYYTAYDKDGNNAYNGSIVLTVSAKTKSDKFTDVTASSYSWAADSIDFLYYEEVVQGSGSKYNPASSITRGDFMIMLYRAFLEDKYGSYTVTSNFADVPKGTSTYEKETYQAVGVAKYLGIALGDGTNFKPKSSITREEAMTLIYRTLEKMDIDLEYAASKTTASFSDYSKVSTYAQTSISYLIRHGIVIGSNGLINPKSNITRAEMAVILHRVLTY
ncbi:MAG: S-layer homology domain-containing protein [Candidatus Avoscillospira sp.]